LPLWFSRDAFTARAVRCPYRRIFQADVGRIRENAAHLVAFERLSSAAARSLYKVRLVKDLPVLGMVAVRTSWAEAGSVVFLVARPEGGVQVLYEARVIDRMGALAAFRVRSRRCGTAMPSSPATGPWSWWWPGRSGLVFRPTAGLEHRRVSGECPVRSLDHVNGGSESMDVTDLAADLPNEAQLLDSAVLGWNFRIVTRRGVREVARGDLSFVGTR
jgi:hypothetical protein